MDDGESEEAREEEEEQEREVDAHVEVLTPLCCAEPSTSLRGVQGNAYTATPQARRPSLLRMIRDMLGIEVNLSVIE